MKNISPKIRPVSVSKLNKYIKTLLDNDFVLKDICVSGEISNLKKHSSGHMYFTLKDAKAQVNCVMFKSYTNSLNFDIQNGMKVCCIGYVSIYEAYGTFQLYTEMIIEDGVGALSIKFEKLKADLEKKGLFDNEHKKDIPEYVNSVAILSASDGAAVKDVIRTIQRRNKLIKIIVVPTIVQGVLSKNSIVNNINDVNKYSALNNDCIDIIILGRGGGSIEDLWSFNEEEVVNAIFNSKVPVISAVGHEIDFTLSDFVSDKRASTPTAAGEMVSTPLSIIENDLAFYKNKMDTLVYDKLSKNKSILQNITSRNVLRRPEQMLFNEEQKLSMLLKSLNNSIDIKYINTKNTLGENMTKLELLNPIKILNNGYTLTYKDDKIIKSASELKINDKLNIRFSDGNVNVIVKSEG